MRFTIRWDGSFYRVSVPNYDGGEVVSAEDYDRLLDTGERLAGIVETYGDPHHQEVLNNWNEASS